MMQPLLDDIIEWEKVHKKYKMKDKGNKDNEKYSDKKKKKQHKK